MVNEAELSASARDRRSAENFWPRLGRWARTFCTQATVAATTAPISSKVATLMPMISGAVSAHGTPSLETNQYEFGPVVANAATTSSPARNALRLRFDRSTDELVASAVSAAIADPTAANAPKWCVHFVGVSASSRKNRAVVPIRRRDGPSAAPGMRPRRRMTTRQVATHNTMSSTGKRLV